MQAIKGWFDWTAVIGPIHMCEQLLFGLDEVDELKGFAESYYSLFSNPDYGAVLLITFSFSLINLIVYDLLKGGRSRLAAMVFLRWSQSARCTTSSKRSFMPPTTSAQQRQFHL